MRVNTRVFDERTDMTGFIQIPNCHAQLKTVAENIINMVAKPSYSIGDYNKITELDKKLAWDYWLEYNDLQTQNGNSLEGLKDWFITKSTPEDLLTRARRWLVEHNYLILKSDVAERAELARDRFARQLTHW